MKIIGEAIINDLKYHIVLNVKRIKKIYMRIKIINNEYYFVINSYKKMSRKEIDILINKHTDSIIKMTNQLTNTLNNENEVLLLGLKYNKEEVTKEMINESINKIISLFNYYKSIFNKQNTLLKFRKMKTRWGVCFITKNYITLTKAIIHIPVELIEYVIIHEFCHFIHPNHSKQFYDYVSIYCPDYKQRKKELKNFSYTLNQNTYF